MVGRRREDTQLGSMPDPWPEPGDYWRIVNSDGSPLEANEEGNLTNLVYMICAPDGSMGNLVRHTIREEDDGTISVRPGDGSSNSILCHTSGENAGWHGYIEHGVWRSV